MRLFAVMVLLLIGTSGADAQKPVSIEGRWKGTSICIARNGPCHDEVVVYHISRIGADTAGTTPLRVTMNKIVNGVEDDMADLAPCAFTHATSSLHCPMPNGRRGDWSFTLSGDKLDGGLWVSDKTKFRDIHVTRDVTPTSSRH